MKGFDRRAWAKLALLFVVVGTLAIYPFHLVRPERPIAGLLLVAALFTAVLALVVLGRGWIRHSMYSSYEPTLALPTSRSRREPGFAAITSMLDSYLTNPSRPDEVHPFLTAIARDRLLHRHGIDLDDEATARPVLGPELADYLYRPPTTSLSGRTQRRLRTLVDRIEEL